jgi:hypothetical protein
LVAGGKWMGGGKASGLDVPKRLSSDHRTGIEAASGMAAEGESLSVARDGYARGKQQPEADLDTVCQGGVLPVKLCPESAFRGEEKPKSHAP